MSEATLILPNMRGGCATANGKVHTLFQLNSRSHRRMARPDEAKTVPTRDDSGAENAAQARDD